MGGIYVAIAHFDDGGGDAPQGTAEKSAANGKGLAAHPFLKHGIIP